MAEVKICGLSTAETLEAALEAGADFVGLVFFPKSPRHVSLQQAADLAAHARGRTQIVALTVDASDDELAGIVEMVRPDWLQLHGRETPERVKAIKSLTGIRTIKAIKVGEASDLQPVPHFATVADMLLFDAKAPAQALPGGNGLSFDWELLKNARLPARYMLSGGLDPANVAEAIRLTGAPLVDVSSGVETAPGKKDVSLIRKFIEAAKRAS